MIKVIQETVKSASILREKFHLVELRAEFCGCRLFARLPLTMKGLEADNTRLRINGRMKRMFEKLEAHQL